MNTIFDIIDHCGVNKITRAIQSNNIACLMYHGVVKDDESLADDNWLQVRESEFRKQMEHLRANYTVVRLEDIPLLKHFEHTKPFAIITFDDGYANNYNVACPILKELGLPATVFVVTDTIDKDHVFWFDKIHSLKGVMSPSELTHLLSDIKTNVHPKDMDRVADLKLIEIVGTKSLSNHTVNTFRTLRLSEINEMADNKISFGSHTHKHELLTSLLNDRDLFATLEESFDVTMTLPGSIPWICYPNGYHNDEIIQLCKDIGYTNGVLDDHGPFNISEINNAAFKIPRIGVGQNTTLSKFSALTSGSHRILKRAA